MLYDAFVQRKMMNEKRMNIYVVSSSESNQAETSPSIGEEVGLMDFGNAHD